MSKRTTFSILFYVNAGRSKGGNAPFYARITAKGKKIDFSLKRKVLLEKWNQNANRPKGSLGESMEVNHHGKYRGNLRAEVQGKLLPVLSNQKLNSYLKEIADLCGVDKNITFHLARHTFATTVTLSNGSTT